MPGALQQGTRAHFRAGTTAWPLERGLMHTKVDTQVAHQPVALHAGWQGGGVHAISMVRVLAPGMVRSDGSGHADRG